MSGTSPGGTARGRPPTTDGERRAERLRVSRLAVGLFEAEGPTQVSFAEIARAAEVSERTLWRLFRTKDSCVEPVLDELLEWMTTLIATWPPTLDFASHLDASTPRLRPDDVAAGFAVIRMGREERGFRAAWLLMHDSVESQIALLLATRAGATVQDASVRLRAAEASANLRVLAEVAAERRSAGRSGAASTAPSAERAWLVDLMSQLGGAQEDVLTHDR